MPSRPRVLFLQYTHPAGYPPLQHAADILLRDGCELLFLGVAGGGGAASLTMRDHPSLTVRSIRAAPAGWRQKLNYACYIAWAVGWRLRWRPDCIYASDTLSAVPALAAGLLPVRLLVYHEHDSPAAAQSAFMRLALAARARLARKSDLVVLPNAERGRQLRAETGAEGDKVVCVWNCPTLDEIPLAVPEKPSDALWLLFHGSIVPDRLPLTLIDALGHLPAQVKLRIVGYETAGSTGYLAQLRGRAEQLGVADRIEVLGALPAREDLLKVARRSHLGLALMPLASRDINMQHMTGASNKPFEYMASGCALLVSELPDWNRMFVEPGFGLACDPQSVESLVRVLTWCCEHPAGLRAMAERGHRAALETIHYEKQFEPVRQRLLAGGDWAR